MTRYLSLAGVAVIVSARSARRRFGARAQAPAPAQAIDEEVPRLIKQHLQDPRISTELVDHLPASDRVPSPLQISWPHRRHAWRAHLRERHPSLLRSARTLVAPRKVLEDRHHRRRPRHRRPRHCRRGDDCGARFVSDRLSALTDPRRTNEADATTARWTPPSRSTTS